MYPAFSGKFWIILAAAAHGALHSRIFDIVTALCFRPDVWVSRYFTPYVCCNTAAFGPGGMPDCWDDLFSFELCCQGRSAPIHSLATLLQQGIRCEDMGQIGRDKEALCIPPFLEMVDAGEVQPFIDAWHNVSSNQLCYQYPTRVMNYFVPSWQRRVWWKAGLLCDTLADLSFTLYRKLIRAHVRPHEGLKVEPIIAKYLDGLGNLMRKLDITTPHLDAFGNEVLSKPDILRQIREYGMSLPALLLEEPPRELHELRELRKWVLSKMRLIAGNAEDAVGGMLDLYAQRIEQAGLFDGCASACTDQWDVVEKLPGKPFDFRSGPTDCPTLLTNKQLWHGSDLYPPPQFPPKRWQHDFHANGVLMEFMVDVQTEGNNTCWYWRTFDNIVQRLRRFGAPMLQTLSPSCVSYGLDYLDTLFTVFTGDRDVWEVEDNPIKGKHWLVIGSETPWIELLLLGAGASKVTTLEYRNEKWMRKTSRHVNFVTPELFPTLRTQFDGAIQYSSVEHAGMGRYGDALNPFADRQTIQAVWCMLKPDAWFLSSQMSNPRVPDVKDTVVFWNTGRAYGYQGLARLFKNFRFHKMFLDTKGDDLLYAFKRAPNSNGTVY
eukprot:GEMP01011651.1.p1 GENE.GEMP01011651.1~~GEMP01011651.1.p1  ORF type:complete len:604 (+),score=105.70 GEMP01011651.1:225-2036(+)